MELTSVYGKAYTATFLDAALSYLEAGGSPRFLGSFNEEEKQWDGLIGKIGKDHLKNMDQAYLNKAASELYPNYSPLSLNRQFWTPFIAVWNHATKGNNPLCKPVIWQRAKVPKKPKPRTSVPYEDAIKLINASSWAGAKILFFLFWSGCRPEEAMNLLAEDVLPERRWAAILETKTGVPRGIPLHNALIPLLAFEKERGGAIFLGPSGKAYNLYKKYNKAGRIIAQSGGQLKYALQSGREATGLNIVPYNARHTVSTYLIWPGGVNPYVKDEILGHADKNNMSKHYVHLPRASLIEAIDVLPDPREMGLRDDLWDPDKIRAMAKIHYKKYN